MNKRKTRTTRHKIEKNKNDPHENLKTNRHILKKNKISKIKPKKK